LNLTMRLILMNFIMFLALAINFFQVGKVIAQSDQISQQELKSGKLIAEKYYSRCHAIGPNDISPHKSAPSFRYISRKWPLSYLEEALAEGITVGHPDMPEFKFEPEQISSLLSFLQWLGDQPDSGGKTKDILPQNSFQN